MTTFKKVCIGMLILFIGCSGVYIILSSDESSYAYTPEEEALILNQGETKTFSSTYNDEELKVNLTLNNITLEDEITAPLPKLNDIVKLTNEEGNKYVKIDLLVNNISAIEINSLELDGDMSLSCTPVVDFGNDNKYTGTTALQLETKESLNSLTTIVSINPNETENVYLVTEVGKNVNLDTYNITICLGDQAIYLNK